MEAVHVSAHLAPPGSLQAKQLCRLRAQLSLGQSCHRQKIFVYMHAGSLRSCPTVCHPVECGLPGFSVRGFIQATTLECIGQQWLPYPSRTLYFLLPELTTLLRLKQLHHLHTWPSQGQTQVLQGSLRSKPQWTTHMQRWK